MWSGVECGGAEGVDDVEGVNRGGVWGGDIFGIFSFEMVHFDAFWSTF